jgi:hypothetical protein
MKPCRPPPHLRDTATPHVPASGAWPAYTVGMAIYSLGQLTLDQLQELAEIRDSGVVPALWDDRKLGELTDEEQAALSLVRKNLISIRTHSLNEATI